MDPQLRDYFDQQLEIVLTQVPQRVRDLLDVVPMYVEDYPSEAVLRRVGLHDRRQLCGLYSGIPLTQRSVGHSGVLSDAIRLYREGIMMISRDASGRLDEPLLREEIRKTMLHELGHHHGFGEEELEALGY